MNRISAVAVACVLVSASSGAGQAPPAQQAELSVQFAQADGLKFARPVPDFRQEVFIISKPPELPFSISMTPFAAPDGTQVDVALSSEGKAIAGPVKTTADGRFVLTVNASFPSADTYTSYLTLTSPGLKPVIVPVVVTRTRAALTVEVKDVMPVEGTPFGGGSVDFTLVETSGRAVRFRAPQLTAIARQLAGGKQTRMDLDTDPTIEVVHPAVAAESNGTYELPGGAAQRFRAKIAGFDGPGDFAGVLRVTSPVSAPVEHKVTFLVRRSVWICFLLVLAGAIAAYVLRYWFETLRPRAERQHRALRLLEEIDRVDANPLVPRARAWVARLRERAERASEQLAGGSTDAEKSVDNLERKLELIAVWAGISAYVEGIEPRDLGDDARVILNGAALVLDRDNASNDEIKAQLEALQAVPSKVEKLIADRLAAELKKLDDAVRARMQARGAAGLQDIVTGIAEARGMSDQPAALLKLRALWALYARVLIADLEAALAAAAPAFVDPAEWAAMKARIKPLLDAAAAFPATAHDQYRAAHTIYLETLLRGLTTKVREAEAQADKLPPEKRAALPAIKTAAEAGVARLAEGKLDEAADKLTSAVASWNALHSKSGALGVNAAPAGQAAPLETLGTLAALVSGTPLWTPGARTRVASSTLRAYITKIDMAVTAVIAIIAALLGVTTLWAVNPTWGSPADLVAALMWGLGLHGFAFGGFKSLAERFSK